LEKYIVADSGYQIPLGIFSDRKLSTTENLVVYLKEHHGLKYRDIARILQRDERTIWTVYNRAKKK
jgi:hypothetical protein